jgi:type I restriction enzyme M protein
VVTTYAPSVEVLATEAIPEGKISDFLTGKIFNDTPEEYVRQNIEKAIVRQYRYDVSDCEPEVRIKVGSSRKAVDIVVFRPGLEHKQENAYLLVETKRAGVNPHDKREGVAQLQSYMAACINAVYGLWTNGDEKLCFAKRQRDDKYYTFEPILEIPRFGQSEAEAQQPKRKDLVPGTADNLLFAFRRCHNYIAGTDGPQKQAAFFELLKLIFCKIEDERSSTLSFYVTPSERVNGTSASTAKARIQKLFTEKVVRKYPTIFPASDSQIDLSASVVAFVVGQLQSYSLLHSPVDVKGVAYEEIVGSNLRGDRGEFFTPRNACRMAVSMLDPAPGERILDPCCGTGGFLITAMNHALAQIERDERSQWADPTNGTDYERQELYRRRTDYLSSCVNGIDLNPTLVRAAKMNMVMNNDGSGGLWQTNSLTNPHTWPDDLARSVAHNSIDVIVTNPPFGAKITIDDEHVLEQFDLAAMWDQDSDGRWTIRVDKSGVRVLQKSQPPEVLFIERCVQLLKEGTGRMGMVIPNGILNNPQYGYVRQWIRNNVQLLAVVDMARDLFQPKNDTQTSMVLMRRLTAEERADASESGLDYPVFMAVAEKVGHDRRGTVLYRRNEIGDDVLVSRYEDVTDIDPDSGRDIQRTIEIRDRVIDDELPEVAEAYRTWLDGQS